jgi:repressor LexA
MHAVLTERQRSILDFITASIRDSGAPSYREIADHFGITVGGLQKQLKALEAKGVLRRATNGAARALRVPAIPSINGLSALPILGRVRAGIPVEAIEHVEDHLLLDRTVAKGVEYVLLAKGDSMEPDILEGDLLLVRCTSDADNGATVVARVGDGDATVKQLRKTRWKSWLEARNPAYPPIQSESIEVIGEVVGLIRRLP